MKQRTQQPPPEPRTWVTCAECERLGHPVASAVGRDGTWFCKDCTDPSWRGELPHGDPRHRGPGQPIVPEYGPAGAPA